MSSRKWLFLVFAFCSFTTQAFAESLETLGAADRLRRLSMMTRGVAPSMADRQEMEQAKDLKSWLAKKSGDYIQSSAFHDKMLENLSRLFLIREPLNDGEPNFSSLHMLFGKVLSENRSWDELLTSKTIGIANKRDGVTTNSFFSNVTTMDERRKIEDYLGKLKWEQVTGRMNGGSQRFGPQNNNAAEHGKYFDLSSPAIAGILTSDAFLNRYWTTAINQNRKRAAAVFRTFLCDEMRAVILPDATASRALIEAGLNQKAGKTVSINASQAQAINQHASDSRCAACHDKLDPLANIFRGGATDLPAKAVPGRLTYKRKSGELVSVPFNNAQELAQALTRQPEYASCQVQHFWNWFIGEDIKMTPEVEAELVAKFNEVGRRPLDFAKYLVNREEFFKFPVLKVEDIQFRHVSGLFRDCQSCHASDNEAPAIGKMPFDGTYFVSHESIVSRIVKKLDLLGDGSKATMPPANAGWKIGSADRTRVVAWMANGAPDDQGRPTWSDPQIQEQLRQRLLEERVSFNLRPTFDLTVKRRLTVREFAREMKQLIQENIGSENTNFEIYLRPSYSDSQSSETFSLETGAGVTTPSNGYIEKIRSITQNVENYLGIRSPSPATLTALGLDWVGDLKAENFMQRSPLYSDEPTTPEICERIGQDIFKRLVGTSPSASEQLAIHNFAQKIVLQKRASVKICISKSFEQIAWSNRHMTY